MSTFDAADPSTWPVTLTVNHIAPIFHKSPKAVWAAIKHGRFPVSPIPNARPMLWRRSDVLRVVEGSRVQLGRTA